MGVKLANYIIADIISVGMGSRFKAVLALFWSPLPRSSALKASPSSGLIRHLLL
jgi:hypothetical protein